MGTNFESSGVSFDTFLQALNLSYVMEALLTPLRTGSATRESYDFHFQQLPQDTTLQSKQTSSYTLIAQVQYKHISIHISHLNFVSLARVHSL
jgi:hypothetical protein